MTKRRTAVNTTTTDSHRDPDTMEMPFASSWRDHLKVHPAADLFPMLAPDELRALGEDIRTNGLHEPVVIWRDAQGHQLLDGRNRLDAMEAVGLDIDRFLASAMRYVESPADPWAYVISRNIHRRHLTAEQKRELLAKVIKAGPEKSDRQIAKIAKTSPTTAGKVRAELMANGDVSRMDTRTDTTGRQQPGHKPKTVRRDWANRALRSVAGHMTSAPITRMITAPVQHVEHNARAVADLWDVAAGAVRALAITRKYCEPFPEQRARAQKIISLLNEFLEDDDPVTPASRDASVTSQAPLRNGYGAAV